MGRLNDKVAVVTGGSRGIGAAIARRFSAEGARVAVVYKAAAEAADEVVTSIEAAGGEATAIRCDVAQTSDCNSMAADVAAAFGGTDILVNNAGIHLLTDLGQTTEDQWDRQMDTNVKGAYFAAQALLPQMMARGGGKIINIGSIVGETAIMRSAVYCASKGALKLLTKSLALDLRPHNIQVNTLSPGCVATDMNARLPGRDRGLCRIPAGPLRAGRSVDDARRHGGHRPLSGVLGFRYGHGANIMVDKGYSAF